MSDNFKDTYHIKDTSKLASPSLLVYPDMVKSNLEKIKKQIDLNRFRPHIKTIKSKELIQMQLNAGIRKFKCATLKESSLLLELGVKDILIAYPLIAYQMEQFLDMVKQNPGIKLQCLVDSISAAQSMDQFAKELEIMVPVYIDVNLGMGRTGVIIQNLEDFYDELLNLDNLDIKGFHGYDGHIRVIDLADRIKVVESYFQEFLKVLKIVEEKANEKLICVFGGSNTFPIYMTYPFVECSPGTFMLWDWGYHENLPEQSFDFAAILFTRIISKPTINHICLDLGYKSVASESPIEQRFHFPEHSNWIPKFQSEEHLVLEVPASEWEGIQVGQELYGIPYHVCPTVAWYPFYQVVEHQEVNNTWAIAGRY